MATDTKEVKAIARYIRMSPYKVRRVLDQIRGRSYREALIILEFMPYRACEPVLKVLRSAAANAEHNEGIDRASLIVSTAFADQGPVFKRYQPRAQGSCLSNSQTHVSYNRCSSCRSRSGVSTQKL